MTRALALAAALAAAALLGATDGAAVRAQNPTLSGTVGPGFSIILRDAQGNRVTKLDPGTYEIEVEDLSDEHNFHLSGPGVDRLTPVEGMGTERWTVTFTEGIYTYVCDPHSTLIHGTFTAGNPRPPPPPPPPPSPTVVTPKSKLVLTSGPSFVITLRTAAGKTVKTMKRGTYSMRVRDRGRIHTAHVRSPGFDKKTTLPFVGTQTWKVKLARVGTLRFLCDSHAGSGMRGSAKIVG